jgi:hypothetical protein
VLGAQLGPERQQVERRARQAGVQSLEVPVADVVEQLLHLTLGEQLKQQPKLRLADVPGAVLLLPPALLDGLDLLGRRARALREARTGGGLLAALHGVRQQPVQAVEPVVSRDRGIAAGPVEAEQLHVGLRHRVGASPQVQLPQDRSQPVAQLVELLAAPRGAHAARRREPLTREPFAEAQQDREAIAHEDRDPAARAHRRRVEPLGRAAVERGEDRAVGQPCVEMQRAPLLEVAQVMAQVLVDRVQPQRGVVLAERLVVAAILDAPLRSLVGEEEVLGQLLAAPRAPRPAVGMTTVGNDARAHAARRAVERVLVAVRPVGAKRGGAAGGGS